MYVIATIFVLLCGVLGKILFDSVFWGAILGLLLCFAGIILFIAMLSKKEAKKAKERKNEDSNSLQNQWDDKAWLKANETEAYQNRYALQYFDAIVDNPGTPKSRKRAINVLWFFCALCGVIALVFTAAMGKAEGMWAVSLLFLVGCMVFAILATYLKKSFAKKYVLWLKAVNHNFLKECRKANIRSLDSKEKIARVQMICEKIGMKGTEEELVLRFKTAVQEDTERKGVLAQRGKQDRIDDLLEKDAEAVEEITNALSYTGREKMIRMCQQEAQKYRDKADRYSDELSAAYNKYEGARRAFSQQEHSAATHGGIASGIAGPVAGVVTAINVEAKNVKIREHNQAVAGAVASVAVNETVPIVEKISEAKKEAEKWEKRAEEAQNKLVENLPEDQLLEMLSPTVAGMTYNAAGTLRISVEVLGAKPIIYEKVPASADGYFRAILKQNDENVGEAILRLPYNGSARKQKLTGICLDAPQKDAIEQVVFEPIKLWAIER